MELENGKGIIFDESMLDECCEEFQEDSTYMIIYNYNALKETDFTLEDWELFLNDLKLKLTKDQNDNLVLRTKTVMQFRFAFTFLRMMLRQRDKKRVLEYFEVRDKVSFDKALAFISRTRDRFGIPLIGIMPNDYQEDPYKRLLEGNYKSMSFLIPKFKIDIKKWISLKMNIQLINSETIEDFLKVDTRSCRVNN